MIRPKWLNDEKNKNVNLFMIAIIVFLVGILLILLSAFISTKIFFHNQNACDEYCQYHNEVSEMKISTADTEYCGEWDATVCETEPSYPASIHLVNYMTNTQGSMDDNIFSVNDEYYEYIMVNDYAYSPDFDAYLMIIQPGSSLQSGKYYYTQINSEEVALIAIDNKGDNALGSESVEFIKEDHDTPQAVPYNTHITLYDKGE